MIISQKDICFGCVRNRWKFFSIEEAMRHRPWAKIENIVHIDKYYVPYISIRKCFDPITNVIYFIEKLPEEYFDIFLDHYDECNFCYCDEWELI